MKTSLGLALLSLVSLAACSGGVDVPSGSSGFGTTGSTSTLGGSTTGIGAGGASTTGGAGGAGNTTGTGGAGNGPTTTTGAGGSPTTTTSTGAGGSAEICPSFGDFCTNCLSTGCPETYCNCYNNPACLKLIQCTNMCNGDAACIQTCETDNQDGIADVVLLTSCAASTCAQQCPKSDAMPIDPCNQCLLTSCEDAANACLAEPECSALYQCLANCPNLDLSCQQGCYADHGAGTMALQDLLQCGSQMCSGSCQ
ncbi:MAG: hypothetical protein U0359_23175 [Byssovorax sp.]